MIEDNIDLDLVEKLNLNGTSVCCKDKDRENRTLYFFVGVTTLAKKLNFPLAEEAAKNVSNIIDEMLTYSFYDIIQIGKRAIEQNTICYY